MIKIKKFKSEKVKPIMKNTLVQNPLMQSSPLLLNQNPQLLQQNEDIDEMIQDNIKKLKINQIEQMKQVG